ncbi:N-acetylmuramidase domain-containing protein [Aquimarina muelleri]|uniref:Peptidoglycan-binding protein n=1 Tax=Aquimarina muelleri TaxID=279356 RepID=A0A918JWM6_9FLAO|nr:N-acetylmuramidase family protein [Aquimarina muelleri]MCX2762572.1 N-acetylmuramidase family protein [Aquimarina muelleri]GGX24116.1 peptidoglycan-binding protein [Aquimarina muelleri]
MKTIRYRSSGQDVHYLEEILTKLGYKVYVSNFFGKDTDIAVKDFQSKHNLVIDGIVGLKTWSKLIEVKKDLTAFNNKLLSEQDVKDFAHQYGLELAMIKAVNEIESNGKGFLICGRPRILFEGHVFWRELEKRGINVTQFVSENNKDVLYKKWTKTHYKGGSGEYDRLEKATKISSDKAFKEAAYCSASWGSFQIMGYHYSTLGYPSIDNFVSKMYEHEREHLNAFGKFIKTTSFKGKKLIDWVKEKNWERFAEGYNGPAYKKNKYDSKLKNAYLRYSND